MRATLALEDLQQLAREAAERYAQLLNQGFQDPGVEKVVLMTLMGGMQTEDNDDCSQYKATADGEFIQIVGPKHTTFVHADDKLTGVDYTYKSGRRTGQYL